MFDPYWRPKNLTPEQWKARGRAIQGRLEGLSIAELMRGGRAGGAPHLHVHGPHRSGYDPNQPRVPAGHPDGGQWTDDHRWKDDDRRASHPLIGIRFAAAERPPRTPRDLVLYIVRKLIDSFRDRYGDLFGPQQEGTVAVTTINGEDVYGTNSTFGDWRAIDYAETNKVRTTLVRRYPHWGRGRNLGHMPLNGLYHAETNALLRAARKNGGSLAGRTLKIFVDRDMCNNCKKILPYVGLELGNPMVTFIEPNGVRRVMRDGRWMD